MNRTSSIAGNAIAIIYFVLVMWWVIILLAIVPVMLFTDINTVLESGFATTDIGLTFMGIFGLFIGLSLLIPPCRRIYHKLPWLYTYVRILFLDVIIMCIALTILNRGYEVQSEARHSLFFTLMVAQIVLCRVAMCIYLRKKPVSA